MEGIIMKLISETNDLHAIVVGSSGGIGKAFCKHLLSLENVTKVTGLSRSETDIDDPKFVSHQIDVCDEASIEDAASHIEPAQLIIIATGILHDDRTMPEKSLNNLNLDQLEHVFKINTFGPALVIKHLAKKMPPKQSSLIVVLSAKVGSISDNFLGGWYGYRASKAALNMMVRTAGIEIQRFHPDHSIVSIHPGTVTTALSNPFTANYPEDKLIDPDGAIARLMTVIDNLGPANNGQFIDWDGSRISY